MFITIAVVATMTVIWVVLLKILYLWRVNSYQGLDTGYYGWITAFLCSTIITGAIDQLAFNSNRTIFAAMLVLILTINTVVIWKAVRAYDKKVFGG